VNDAIVRAHVALVAAGTDGVDGKPGKSGKDGKRGYTGVDGKDGVPGKDGKDGVPGWNGDARFDLSLNRTRAASLVCPSEQRLALAGMAGLAGLRA
jgi:hypothetical protein